MLVKASIAAALIVAAVGLSSIDYRDLYNEMYPVNGLKRDVLDLCHEAQPTFVRAVASDRIGCYDSMPDNIDLAIGWVRTTSRLAALRRRPSAIEAAERLLVEETQRGGLGFGPRRFTGYVSVPVTPRPCVATALASLPDRTGVALDESDEHLAQQIAKGDELSLAPFGLARHSAKPDTMRDPDLVLPKLPGGGTPSLAAPVSLANPERGATLPLQFAAGCRTPV
jgi:hypothetical protein